MFEKIVNIIADYQSIPADSITLKSHLVNDLGLNSYDVVMLVCEFEDAFNIEIEDKDILKFQRISDIVTYLETVFDDNISSGTARKKVFLL